MNATDIEAMPIAKVERVEKYTVVCPFCHYPQSAPSPDGKASLSSFLIYRCRDVFCRKKFILGYDNDKRES